MDRIADESGRDLALELEREVHRLRGEVATAHKVIIWLLMLLAVALMWTADLGLDRDRNARIVAYEVADRCVRECDCSRIGPEPDR